jgi:hypothetical protein
MKSRCRNSDLWVVRQRAKPRQGARILADKSRISRRADWQRYTAVSSRNIHADVDDAIDYFYIPNIYRGFR